MGISSKNSSSMEELFDEMLKTQAEEIAKEKMEENVSSEEQKKVQADTVGVLSKFKDYIKSRRFKNKCKDEAKKTGVSYKVVRNVFISKILGKIADVLNLAINITAEVIMYSIEFLNRVINVVATFTASVCYKIVNLFTLNCGQPINA